MRCVVQLMILVLFCYSSSGAIADQKVGVRAYSSLILKGAELTIYDPSIKAKRIYTDISQAECKTPEELMNSVESEVTQKWITHNWLPKTKTHKVPQKKFKYRMDRDKETNYKKLISKFSFLYNGTPSVIVKFYFIENGKRAILSSCFMQKKDGRWFLAVLPEDLMKLTLIVQRLKPSVFLKIIQNNLDAADSTLVKNISKKSHIKPSGVLDMERLYNEIHNLLAKKDYENYVKICDRSFPDKPLVTKKSHDEK